MEEINLIIAKNLKAFRESKKLSLEKVAELTGVSKTMIGQIERGESSPNHYNNLENSKWIKNFFYFPNK